MKELIARYGTPLTGVLIVILLMIFAPNFASIGNSLSILKQASFLIILSIGFTFALITSELDLSFANICSLAAVIVGGLIYAGIAWPLAAFAGILVGLVGGMMNGFLVTTLKVPSLIATLGTSSIATGLAFMVTGGVAFVGRWDRTFLSISRGNLYGVPNLVLITIAIALLAWFYSTRTKRGLHMLITGEAGDAAHRAGIATIKMKRLGLSLSGLAAGLAAVLLVSNLSSASPQMAGDFLMNGIAAVLLGMTMFDPGRPNILGTCVGALMIAVIGNGLVLLGAPYYLQSIMLGLIVIGSVSVSASTLKKAALSL